MNMLPDFKVSCHDCGSDVAQDNCRIKSKSKQTFTCLQCKVKTTQLYRSVDGWPPVTFSRGNLEDKQRFMRDCKDVNAKALPAMAKRFHESYEVKERSYAKGGQFLPLPKWAHDGFDAESIKAKSLPEDIIEHSVLGTCYRVSILEKTERGISGTKEGDHVVGNQAICTNLAQARLNVSNFHTAMCVYKCIHIQLKIAM